jgi:phosphoribosylformylglycinamidine cyclo-ligase
MPKLCSRRAPAGRQASAMSRSVESEVYTRLGVSAEKADVEIAAAPIGRGRFEHAFCRVFPDIFGQDPSRCILSHSDGAGTKAIVAYLLYRSTGDASAFRKIAHDAVIMNLDDMLCAGAVTNLTFVSTINRNSKRIGAEVLKAVIDGTLETVAKLSEFGINIIFCGGETADVGDIVRSVLVDGALTTQMPLSEIVRNELQPGHVVVALSSSGKAATYEDHENSGIGANGLSLARHALLDSNKLYSLSEVSDDARDGANSYFGKYSLTDRLPNSSFTIADALLSPTRTFAPIVRDVLATDRRAVSGIFHLTGGGQFKTFKVANRVRIVKEVPPVIPQIFHVIRESADLSWLEMARVFNLGWRMEIYCDKQFASQVLSISKRYNVDAAIVGFVKPSSSGAGELELTVLGETERVTG